MTPEELKECEHCVDMGDGGRLASDLLDSLHKATEEITILKDLCTNYLTQISQYQKVMESSDTGTHVFIRRKKKHGYETNDQ